MQPDGRAGDIRHRLQVKREQHQRPDARRSRHGLRLLQQLECQSGQPERAEPAELSRELDAAQKEPGTSLGAPRGQSGAQQELNA